MSELHPDLARVIISTDDIQRRVSELAQQISKDHVNDGQVFLIGILKGAFIFLADLARQLTIPNTVDLWHYPVTEKQPHQVQCEFLWICATRFTTNM